MVSLPSSRGKSLMNIPLPLRLCCLPKLIRSYYECLPYTGLKMLTIYSEDSVQPSPFVIKFSLKKSFLSKRGERVEKYGQAGATGWVPIFFFPISSLKANLEIYHTSVELILIFRHKIKKDDCPSPTEEKVSPSVNPRSLTSQLELEPWWGMNVGRTPVSILQFYITSTPTPKPLLSRSLIPA